MTPDDDTPLTPPAPVQDWEAEGGSLTPPPDGHVERLLQRLGAALVDEWATLPTPLQRAVYERAVAGAPAGDVQLRHDIALYLHRHGSDRPNG